MRTMTIAALAAGVAANSASAEPTYSFRNNTAATGWTGAHGHRGTFEPVRAEFDPVANRIFFEAAFADGLALAGDPGHTLTQYRSEMARFSSGDAGRHLARPSHFGSERDGAENSGWAGTAADPENAGEPTLTFGVDAAAILGYRHDGGTADRSADSFGFWLHSLRKYDAGRNDRRGGGGGALHALREFEDSGFDGAELPMNVVPLPTGAAMAVLGLAGIAAGRRRG